MNGEKDSICEPLPQLSPVLCRDRAASFARTLNQRLQKLEMPDSETKIEEFNFETEFGYESPTQGGEYLSEDDPFYIYEQQNISNLRNNIERVRLQNNVDCESNNVPNLAVFNLCENEAIIRQPHPKLNEETLFTAINLDDCERCCNFTYGEDTVDSIINTNIEPKECVWCNQLPSTDEGDSDFESARSETLESEEDAILYNNNEVNTKVNKSHQDIPRALSIENQNEINCEDNNGVHLDDNNPWQEVQLAIKTFREHNVDTGSSEEDSHKQFRRCSSLKTGRTPPSTPGRKKIVRFADALGLDLADVKTFLDEVPVIPKSAYSDLVNADNAGSFPCVPEANKTEDKVLVPLFQIARNIEVALEKNNVVLESATVTTGTSITICGLVSVRNLDFHKIVHVRYTTDHWRTYSDLQAYFCQGSSDGFSDRFQFLLYMPLILVGQKLEFAIKFQCNGLQYWDNNSGANYCYDCVSFGSTEKSALPPADNWQRSFY